MGIAQARTIVGHLVVLTFAASAFALDPSLDVSQYAHTAWRVRDGFSQGPIHSIAQTPDGYLWLATEFGLRRFDGVRTVQWQPPAGEHLPSEVVTKLLVSRDGTLWIGTATGLASWKDGKLTQYPELVGWTVRGLVQDHEGAVWAGGYAPAAPGKLCAVKDGLARCSSVAQGVMGLYEDPKRTLWASTFTGIWRWKPQTPKFFPMGPRTTAAMFEDKDGGLLVGSFAGIRRLMDGETTQFPLGRMIQQPSVYCFLRDHDGGLWVGTSAGLVHLHDGRTDVFRQVDGLSADHVHALFEDREGDIWAATEGGLDRFRDFAIPMFSSNEGFTPGTYGSIVAARDGTLWFATPDRLTRWRNWEITVYGRPRPTSSFGAVTASHEIPESGLRHHVVESIFQDSRGRLWVTVLGGFGYMDKGRFVLMKAVPGEDNGSIAEGADGSLWIDFVDTIFHLKNGKIIEQISGEALGKKDELGGQLAVDPIQGGLWIGFWQGGIAYLRRGQIVRSYTAADGLGKGRISHLRVDREGALWAATEGGLSRIQNGHVKTLSTKNGLPCDGVHWSEEDTSHSVWLYMDCGMVRVAWSDMAAWVEDSQRSIRLTKLDSYDGAEAKSGVFGTFNPPVSESPDGKLWFTVEDGVSVIDPRHPYFNRRSPPVHIEQVIADGKTYWQNFVGASPSNPVLPPLLRDLTIDFTALSLVIPEKVHFRFKLEGQDKDWREVVNQRSVDYSNLPPGNYRFRVIACNNSGVWNEQGAELDFSIAPAYWQTNWFRALCLAVFMSMLWAIYQRRVRTLERRHAEVRALNEQMVKAQEAERMRIAGDLHDGVMQQITSLTLRLGKVRRQVPPDSEAIETVNGLQQQLIKIGDDIRHLSHELHPALLQDAGLSAAVSAYCEEFSKVHGIPVPCEADESVEQLSPGAALCLYRIAQEALGNAAKHSAAKKVEVRLTRSDGFVCLSVSDDGVGCDPSQTGKSGGLGVISMRERVVPLGGTFEFDSEPGRGTTVRVTVPFRLAS